MARQAPEPDIPSRELFENNPLPMWVYDLETLAFLAVNDSAVRQYGYSRREFLVMTIKEIRPPEDIPLLRGKIARPVEGHDAPGTWRHRKKDGTIIDVEIITHSLTFAGRRAKLVMTNDITERQRLEQVFHTAAREWRKAFDAMNEAIAWIDREGRIVRCNKALTILVKKNYHDIIGHHCEEVIYGTSVPAAGCPIKEVMTTHQRSTSTLTSGSQVYKITADPLFSESGEFIGAVHIISDVTQHEQAEKVLRDLVLQQEAILDNIPDIAWLKDDQSRFLAVNEPFSRACGIAPVELVGKTDLEIWPRELAERYQADDREVMRSGRRKVIEEPLVDKAGKTAWIETIKTPIIDEQGRVVGTTGIARDITARKESEDKLKASEEKFRTLFDTANDAIFILEMNGQFVDVNTVAHQRLGYTKEELLAKSVAELDPPEFAARVPERIEEIKKYGKAVFESVHLRKDGTVMPVEINARVIDYEGRKVLYSIIRDITARKEAEAAMQESEERYRDLFENANDAIFLLDSQQRFLDANKMAEELTGYTREELRTMSVLNILPQDQVQAAKASLGKLETEGSFNRVERRLCRKSGCSIEIEVSSSAIVKDGKLAGSRDIVRDITERKKLQEDVYRISQDWEETFNTLTDMVTVHDKDFNIIRANMAAEKILGLPFLEVKKVKCFEYFHGTECPPEGCPSCASLVTGKPAVNEIYEPHLGRHLEIRAIPRLDRNQQVVGLIHVVRDIAERKAAETARDERMKLAEFGMHVGTALNTEGPLQEILEACTKAMVENLDAALARIWTLSPDQRFLELQASSGLYTHLDGPHGLIPIEKEQKIPTIARTREPHLTNAVIGDTQVDQAWAQKEGIVAFAGYPLLLGAHLVGVLGLFSRKPLSDFILKSLEVTAKNIALGIERKRSEEALKKYGQELAALSDASNSLLALTSIADIYAGICAISEKVFNLELVWLGTIRAGSADVTVAASAGAAREYLRNLTVTWDNSPTGNGPTGLAIKTRQPWSANKDTPAFAPWRAAAAELGLETSLAVPLITTTGSGECIGALNFYSRRPGYFTPDKIRLCQIFANQAAIAIENARLIAGLEEKVAARTRELELRRVDAESANQAKSDFLANMSHELRTPLNAIIGFSDMMIRGMSGPLTERQQEFLGDILTGGRHLLSLINDILDLSKVEAGKMEIEPSEYDLAGLLDRSLVLFREKALTHRLDLRAGIEDTIAPVFGDERKIRQVLYNLVSNAVKFTPDGGSIIVRAKTVREEGRDYVEIAVSDTGVGISPEDQKQLFQPFSQIGHYLTKEHEGTGLGLALCKSFVEMHAGRIRVESTPGRGSTFTFRIPHRFGEDAP